MIQNKIRNKSTLVLVLYDDIVELKGVGYIYITIYDLSIPIAFNIRLVGEESG